MGRDNKETFVVAEAKWAEPQTAEAMGTIASGVEVRGAEARDVATGGQKQSGGVHGAG